MTKYQTDAFRRDLITFMRSQDPEAEWVPADNRAEDIDALTPEAALPVVVRWAAEQILADVAGGVVPPSVESFAALHDHVDANGYGGAFDWPGPWPCDEPGESYVNDHCRFWNAVQDRLDTWIRSGGIREHRLPQGNA